MSKCIECGRLIDGDYQEIHNDCYETIQIQLSEAKAENVRLLKGQCHPACEAKLNDLKAENARLKEALETLNKELLLQWLNERIESYEGNKYPGYPSVFNSGVVNAYEWLKDIIEDNKLRGSLSGTGNALKPVDPAADLKEG